MDEKIKARADEIAKQVLAQKGAEDYSPTEIMLSIDIKMLQSDQDNLYSIIKRQQEMIDAMHVLLHETRCELQKLNQVYYHVFPDRLEQDVRLDEQLRALKIVPGADGEKKGS
jgi:hypothetical protein